MIVDSGVAGNNGVRDVPFTVTVKALPNGTPGVINGTSRIGRKVRSGLTSNPRIGNWRNPSGYASLHERATYNSFSYTLTDAFRQATSHTCATGAAVVQYSWQNQTLYGLASSVGAVPDVSSNMYNQAVTEALNKMTNSKLNLGVALAESGKSLSMIALKTVQVLQAFRQAKRGRFRNAARILSGLGPRTGGRKATAKNWLELQYGWMPLLSDIYGGYQALQRGMRENNQQFSVERTVTRPYPLPPRPLNATDWEISGTASVGVKVKIYSSVKSTTVDLVNSLGLINPLEIAWELVPFSFVLDWLLPVGNVLNALTASMGVSFRSGTVTKKFWCDVNWKFCQRDKTHAPTGLRPSGNLRKVCVNRTVLTGFPSPRLYVKSPFSALHIVNAIALLSQMRR